MAKACSWLKNAAGQLRYSRDGQFQFDKNGILVSRTDGSTVMGVGADGKLTSIGLSGLRSNPAKATSTITFSGNLSSTTSPQTVSSIKVVDASGGEHELSLAFTEDATTSGLWKVSVLDGTTEVGTGSVTFVDGKPVTANAKFNISYKPAGQSTLALVFDFTGDVTSYAAGNLSTLAMSTQGRLRRRWAFFGRLRCQRSAGAGLFERADGQGHEGRAGPRRFHRCARRQR